MFLKIDFNEFDILYNLKCSPLAKQNLLFPFPIQISVRKLLIIFYLYIKEGSTDCIQTFS